MNDASDNKLGLKTGNSLDVARDDENPTKPFVVIIVRFKFSMTATIDSTTGHSTLNVIVSHLYRLVVSGTTRNCVLLQWLSIKRITLFLIKTTGELLVETLVET